MLISGYRRGEVTKSNTDMNEEVKFTDYKIIGTDGLLLRMES
jgi:hypothetical protein